MGDSIQTRVQDHEEHLESLKEAAKRYPRAETMCIEDGRYVLACEEALADATDFDIVPGSKGSFFLHPYVTVGTVRVYGKHRWGFASDAAIVFTRMKERRRDLYTHVLNFVKAQAEG